MTVDCSPRGGSRVPHRLSLVTAIETTTGARYGTTTGINGGYTIKVPVGVYRLEVELRSGEAIEKAPGETRVNKSDLDAGRNFVVTVKP